VHLSGEAVNRHAAYENTKMEPEEIMELKKKATAMMPRRTSVGESTDFNLNCPCCGYRFISNIGGEHIAGECTRNCPNCGQAMRWS